MPSLSLVVYIIIYTTRTAAANETSHAERLVREHTLTLRKHVAKYVDFNERNTSRNGRVV